MGGTNSHLRCWNPIMKLMIKTFDPLWKRERASFPSRHDFTPQIYG